jgi:hypothetical protein
MTPPLNLDPATVQAFSAARFTAGQAAGHAIGHTAGQAVGHAAGLKAAKQGLIAPLAVGALVIAGVAVLYIFFHDQPGDRKIQRVITSEDLQKQANREAELAKRQSQGRWV